jgi:hypothetical protein
LALPEDFQTTFLELMHNKLDNKTNSLSKYGSNNGGQQQSYSNQQPFSGQFQGGQFTGGPQAVFQHGFAGTDAQQVRQQNQQSAQGGQQFGGNQFGQGNFYGQH